MILNIFDTHAHYDDEAFDADRNEILSHVRNSGVELIINCGCDLRSSLRAIELSERYDFIYAAAGVHPEEVEDIDSDELQKIARLYSHKKVVAVGEIGLDYHWDMPRDLQLEIFEKQLMTAEELDLPVIIHDREAHGDTLALLKKHRVKGVLHCFSGSAEMAQEVIGMGMYIGLGGSLTFKNAKKPVSVAKAVPIERILLETDCPYMAPVPYRGKRCDSAMISEVAKFLGEIKGIDPQKVADQCTENGKSLFNIS